MAVEQERVYVPAIGVTQDDSGIEDGSVGSYLVLEFDKGILVPALFNSMFTYDYSH